MENDALQQENADGLQIVSELPPPPAFYKLYAAGPDAGPPPPALPDDTYYMFGLPYSTKHEVPDLFENMPEKRLYNPDDIAVGISNGQSSQGNIVRFRQELKKLNKSMLVSFVQLVDVLIRAPTEHKTKVQDLEQLFLNMHNLINSYRPHQARETLIEALKQQIARRKAAIKETEESIEEMKTLLTTGYEELSATLDTLPLELTPQKKLATASSVASWRKSPPRKDGKVYGSLVATTAAEAAKLDEDHMDILNQLDSL